MAAFRVTFNDADLLRKLKELPDTMAKRIVPRALNRSGASGRTVMVREVAKDLQLKQDVVRDRMVVREATASEHVYRLRASARRIPLIEFNARGPEPSYGRGAGVTARTRVGRYRQAFIATMGSGHRGVFSRSPGARRLPIYELKQPSIAFVFDKHLPAGMNRAQEQLIKNLTHEISFALSKR